MFEWKFYFKIAVVKISTRSNGNSAIGFPIVQTAVKDPGALYLLPFELCPVFCGWRPPKMTETPGHNSRALSYRAPGIFQGTYVSKESFEPNGVFRS